MAPIKLAILAAIASLPSTTSAQSSFYLQNGDRVAFYGDSITAQRFYTHEVQDYVATRYPQLKIEFHNAGIAGDTVRGGYSGDVATRVSRDVKPWHPNVITIMLGMNDGGYCVSVFGAGGVTHDSVVRGNLCINNGRSPRMADYQGAIFVWTWDGGSIDRLTIEKNTVYWGPFENRPAVQNRADIQGVSAVFRNNTIISTAPAMVESNAHMSLAGNSYQFLGSGKAEWTYGGERFRDLRRLQGDTGQENGGSFERLPLKNWPDSLRGHVASMPWTLDCVLPVKIDTRGLIDNSTLQSLVLVKSFAQQYGAQGLTLKIEMTSSDPKLFGTEAYRNLVTDLELPGRAITRVIGSAAARIMLRRPDGQLAGEWKLPIGPVPLGLALRKAFGEPAFSQMPADHL